MIDVVKVRELLKSFDFSTVFREHLGWDKHHAQLLIPVNERSYPLTAIAEKRGFVVYTCPTIPDRAIRLKIDHQAIKSAREHIVIYADAGLGQQLWQWVRREPGRPIASREIRFNVRQTGDLLIQKLDQIAVSMREEEQVTIVDITGRARAAFDVDRVTKQFYERFRKEHQAFFKLVTGIGSDADLQWYTSLMLNRLMFVYFIQKKGFLDGDLHYLRNRLKIVQKQRGKDEFQTFYRYFLLRLFHDGLGKLERSPELDKLLGKVPYLNGGFFEVHQLEERYDDIDIPDKAFERLFDFFDEYTWHLDERPLREGNEINPDVVGYIFEKYINQKQMGAYYTKEDITEYISKNTVIPFLFDAALKKCSIAFQAGSALWRLLRDDPDRYLYAAVRHGVITQDGRVIPLPPEIEAGIEDVSKRVGWNRPAADPYALPTETWREHVARRARCLELREKLRSGEVHEINDLITLNLDVWQFARDAIANCEGPELLRAFWHALQSVTILDPTCGSGAFLFSALRILESLYSDCLERMEQFLSDLEGKPHHPEKYGDFRGILEQVAKHPNERYFVLKSIIINNLFGVDIMEEAVEICKLRLFLKLVAQVDTAAKIEPLPDIDFNIRAGNTLVGYADLAEVRKSMGGKLGFTQKLLKRIDEEALVVESAFNQFRGQQTKYGGKVTSKDKAELRSRLQKLDLELDRYLAGDYRVDPDNPKEFEAWRTSHQPFHWLVEFYGIMKNGGFDVIIGNPPYVEYRLVRDTYTVLDSLYSSMQAKNLYALCMERCVGLVNGAGRFSMIVPAGLLGLDDAASLRDVLLSAYSHIYASSYSIRPSKLFDGVDQRLSIFVAARGKSPQPHIFTTRYHHWHGEERPSLLPILRYGSSCLHPVLHRIPQIGSPQAGGVLSKLEVKRSRTIGSYHARSNGHLLHYHRSPRYWIRAMDFEQYFRSESRQRSVYHFRDLYFDGKAEAKIIGATLNSSLFFFWFLAVGNGRNITGTDIEAFPIGDFSPYLKESLPKIFDKLMDDFDRNSFVRKRADCEFQEFRVNLSKPILDQIDRILGGHYGFTDEELDFILNFEIKYRLGAEEDDED